LYNFLNLIQVHIAQLQVTFDKHVEIHLNNRKYYIIQKNLKLLLDKLDVVYEVFKMYWILKIFHFASYFTRVD
jgi:hypothetical protein